MNYTKPIGLPDNMIFSYPMSRANDELIDDKYLILSQPENEPRDGFNLVIQEIEHPHTIHVVQSIDFEDL